MAPMNEIPRNVLISRFICRVIPFYNEKSGLTIKTAKKQRDFLCLFAEETGQTVSKEVNNTVLLRRQLIFDGDYKR